jgi:hypothetical protein
MPPYAGDFLSNNNNKNNDIATYPSDIVAVNTKPTESVMEDEFSGSEKIGRFDTLLECNPCTTMSDAGHSMSSAIFKARPCNWCGNSCNKVKENTLCDFIGGRCMINDII